MLSRPAIPVLVMRHGLATLEPNNRRTHGIAQFSVVFRVCAADPAGDRPGIAFDAVHN